MVVVFAIVRYVGTKTRNVFGAGSGQIWLDNVQCTGTETDIGDCSHAGWGVNDCQHYEDVALSCTTGRFRASIKPSW